jgi:hypothetical protein
MSLYYDVVLWILSHLREKVKVCLKKRFLFAEIVPLKKRDRYTMAKMRDSYRKYHIFDLIIKNFITLLDRINAHTVLNCIKTRNNDIGSHFLDVYNNPYGISLSKSID